MAKTIFDATARDALIKRIGNLRPDSARMFGTMSPNQMLCHLEDAVVCATGQKPCRFHKSFKSNPLVRWLAIYWLPWPKGVRTAREYLLTQPGEFDADRQRLIRVLNEASARGARAEWAPHPAFGNIGGKHYGALIHRHVDYHLKQFGV
jgi:hypothetical protein